MVYFLDTIYSSFWNFLGFLIILYLILHYMFISWNRFLRHLNIRKHGYPPPHCDSDGDHVKTEDNK